MKSKLFFNHSTCIDHAFIDNQGLVMGGSYHPVITVAGRVTEDENVVVDFSSGKKRLKAIIDHDDGKIGFDHKLWVIPGYSACSIGNYSDTHFEITTGIGTIIRLPKTDVHVVGVNYNGSIASTVAEDMKIILERELNGEFEIDVTLTQMPFSITENPLMFRYSHGLKSSTSYGCKNIAHGHLSFLEVTKRKPEYRTDCQDCQIGDRLIKEWIAIINESMFIMRENIIDDNGTEITVRYDTPRGEMYMKINRNHQPHVITETETTIEHLAAFIEKRLMNAFILAKVEEFRVSEGLQKGVVYRVSDIDDSAVIF